MPVYKDLGEYIREGDPPLLGAPYVNLEAEKEEERLEEERKEEERLE
jgi:hypothetical protein